MPAPVRFGITGCGYIGAEQARIIHSLPGAELIAVHSASGTGARRVADELPCDVENSLESLVARDDVDALIVATPNHLHREPVTVAAAHGKHVFCEKPFALSVEDCDAMVAACTRAGVTLMLGHMMHFYPGMRRVREWIESGTIGRVLVAHAERTGWEEPRPDVSWKKVQDTSGGHLFHHIHEIDLLLWFAGAVASVRAVGGNLAHQGEGFGDEDDVVLLTLTFADGGFGSMQYGSGFRWGEHLVKINGTEGAVLIDNKAASVFLKVGDAAPQQFGLFDDADSEESMQALFKDVDGGSTYGSPTDRPPLYLRRAVRDELACFIDVVTGFPIDDDKKMLFDGSAARASVQVAQAALQSLRDGAPAPVAP
ncbi:Gfo/Idh/MocA family oxidoreductase [Ruania alkalisoli]|uniref:Gfo/Idh/MocA family oxidoreductase n=1 Tax=Ruania alkalisoli TaxID=2779775 RepID=A0A7M1SSL1_9MICO|nr:Gfo/Idh/MocA family oxidoreductase [Ruania alkalisoli]QOR70558.1 Gfo/Idh/MocA family oxidoreductase [Ruania alkalisoli]